MQPDLPYSNKSEASHEGFAKKSQAVWPTLASTLQANESPLVNHAEPRSFFKTAFTWHGSVTPHVFPRVIIASLYAAAVFYGSLFFPHYTFSITPFEYSGAVLGLLLVLRINAGQDRWWEARKIWGTIVNQSRNLAIVIHAYSEKDFYLTRQILPWIAAWPHVMRESLRKEKTLLEVEELLGKAEAESIRQAEHMPIYIGLRISQFLAELKSQGLDSFVFHRAETERSQLIDAIGACERIKNTRMPFVLVIKVRRFILLFLLLLPFALADRAGWLTPLVVALTSYPLFSLDEIGAELQNPFSSRNLSHLPLNSICKTIENNILGLMLASPHLFAGRNNHIQDPQ